MTAGTWNIVALRGTGGTEAARRGRFVAEFTRAADAQRFYDRLVASPAGDYVVPGSIRRNRANGRLVAWDADPDRIKGTDGDGRPAWLSYWMDLAETVGYYGSTFGEPPFGTGKRTAYLNGLAGTASM